MKALNDLLAKLGEAADTVTDEQLSDAVTAIREQLAAVEQMPSASIADRNARIEVLTGIKAVRDAVAGEQASRTAAAADLDAEAQRLMDDITADPAPVEPADKSSDDGDSRRQRRGARRAGPRARRSLRRRHRRGARRRCRRRGGPGHDRPHRYRTG
jgi:hypothetical protein